MNKTNLPSNNYGKERLEWLDAVKGICIILIMISHYCSIPQFGYYLFAGYVQVFFIASGYTFKTIWSKEAIFKRMNRLLIPYFFMAASFGDFCSLKKTICCKFCWIIIFKTQFVSY